MSPMHVLQARNARAEHVQVHGHKAPKHVQVHVYGWPKQVHVHG